MTLKPGQQQPQFTLPHLMPMYSGYGKLVNLNSPGFLRSETGGFQFSNRHNL